MIKDPYEKPIADTVLFNSETLIAFMLRSGTKQKCLFNIILEF